MRLVLVFAAAALASGCGASGEEGSEQLAAASASLTIDLPPDPQAQEPVAPAAVPPPEAAEAPEAEKAEKPADKEPETAKKPEEKPKPVETAAAEPPAEEKPASKPAAPDEDRPVQARLPLSNDQIVRTIEKIGYRCGNVLSASTAEQRNAQGHTVYRIACASGETYRGTSRNGRMVFRPWNGKLSGR